MAHLYHVEVTAVKPDTAHPNVNEAFGYVNLDWRDYVEDPRDRRPTEVPLLQADPSEAKRRLGWQPTVAFRDLVRIMMDADLEAAGRPAAGQGTHRLTDGRLPWLQWL